MKETKKETENEKGNEKGEEYSEEDEFNPSLAAMEEEIKPKIVSTINILAKNYSKLSLFSAATVSRHQFDCDAAVSYTHITLPTISSV